MKTAFSFLAVLLLLGSCAKDSPEAGLPKATQEGKNTADCLINGERFVATGYGPGLSRVGPLRCMVPTCDGVFSGLAFRTELGDKYATAAPAQLRPYGPLSNVVRKAYKR